MQNQASQVRWAQETCAGGPGVGVSAELTVVAGGVDDQVELPHEAGGPRGVGLKPWVR